MIAVREWDSKNWRLITIEEWKAAEDRAGKNSAFAETRQDCPTGYKDLFHWVECINNN